jgi:murein DD-endopeptidase MepM/ murein hydrolase activator NlpD
MNFKAITFLIVVAIIAMSIINLKYFENQPALGKKGDAKVVDDLPIISYLPKVVLPGYPVMVTITASSTVNEINFDSKKVSTFKYENKTRAFIAIPFEEKESIHNIGLKLSNGMVLNKVVSVKKREKVERPLGIPEKLGGNTKQAANNLINTLASENKSISGITSSPIPLWSKTFVSPLKDLKVTDEYGYNRDTVGRTIVHKGTDFHAELDTEVHAMNDGVVKIANLFTVYGNAVIIDHGLGLQTLYMHLSKLNVKVADKVVAGQVIGLSGQTGYVEAPHLHVSIKINGVSIDPVKFLEFFHVI